MVRRYPEPGILTHMRVFAIVVGALVLLGAPSRNPTHAATAPGPSVRQLVGQRFVVAMRGPTPSRALLARIRRGEVGGVILFGSNIQSSAQLRELSVGLQRAAREGGRPPLLVATDQEGGRVRRLPWVGPERPAAELGRLSAAAIRLEGRRAGRALRLAGVNVDLAPVGDVPAGASFMAAERRTFGSDGARVATAATAFARGLAEGGVAAAIKHFPGIGRAGRNTDRAAVEIAASRGDLDRDLGPFRLAVAADVPIVMMSNATYPALDAKPAAWSPRALALLRNELGFGGVSITDALDAAAATRGRTVPSVAVLAALAGVDLLLLTGREAATAAAFERVVHLAEQGRIPRASLQASYERIVELKRRFG